LKFQKFIVDYKRQATADMFGFTTLQQTYKGLTESYRTMFTNFADSYDNAYVSQ